MIELNLHDEGIVEVDKFPDHCPICNCHVHPFFVAAHQVDVLLQVVYQCVRTECGKLFISEYSLHGFNGVYREYTYSGRSIPVIFKATEFSEGINDLSPNFVNIYNQAEEAESRGLTEICGVGYRKSLEFLVKDYLISLNPAEADNIKSKPLGNCIQDIQNADIKFCAQRATWLGNDETHYIRKWETKDLTDLKTLIELMLNWLKNEMLMKKYREEMAEGIR